MNTFYTTQHINELIKKDYFDFISKHYTDILKSPSVYISLVEKYISEYLWGGYVKLLNSWTTALQFWLLAYDIWPGDEVILPANGYAADAIVITNIWATPVFCDISLEDYTMDLDSFQKCMSPNTKAVIPIHIYGHSCNMNEIYNIAQRNNIKIIEDASHSFGWEYFWKKLGTLWDIWAFSCHVSKNFGTLWNGWIFYTKQKYIYDKISKYIYPDSLDEKIINSWRTPAGMQAFDSLVLLHKLKHIDHIIESNINLYQENKSRYQNDTMTFPDLDFINTKPHIRNMTVIAKDRDIYIKKWLWKKYYTLNLLEHPSFQKYNINDLTNTTSFFHQNLSLNFYYWMKLL